MLCKPIRNRRIFHAGNINASRSLWMQVHNADASYARISYLSRYGKCIILSYLFFPLFPTRPVRPSSIYHSASAFSEFLSDSLLIRWLHTRVRIPLTNLMTMVNETRRSQWQSTIGNFFASPFDVADTIAWNLFNRPIHQSN